METECVCETSEDFKQMTRLSAREEFIHTTFVVKPLRRESFVERWDILEDDTRRDLKNRGENIEYTRVAFQCPVIGICERDNELLC
jgi:hypothetical protein